MAGAAPVAGPGTGGGGVGAGTGSGQGRGGTGDGVVIAARHIGGGISDRDYPRALRGSYIGGTTVVHLWVGVHGRVKACSVARSSGNALLDETTCRLARKRFVYAPARDASGKAVTDVAGWKEEWLIDADARPSR